MIGRVAFTNSFYDAIEGIEPSPVPVRFRSAHGARDYKIVRQGLDPEGNELSPDAQWAKLEAVARAADEVWGRAG